MKPKDSSFTVTRDQERLISTQSFLLLIVVRCLRHIAELISNAQLADQEQ